MNLEACTSEAGGEIVHYFMNLYGVKTQHNILGLRVETPQWNFAGIKIALIQAYLSLRVYQSP